LRVIGDGKNDAAQNVAETALDLSFPSYMTALVLLVSRPAGCSRVIDHLHHNIKRCFTNDAPNGPRGGVMKCSLPLLEALAAAAASAAISKLELSLGIDSMWRLGHTRLVCGHPPESMCGTGRISASFGGTVCSRKDLLNAYAEAIS
jgi:hypothetical protein